MINLSSIDVTNKNLVIRVDMNVPLKNGNVLDATRIEACLPTIYYALKNDANILLISHLGRPTEGKFEEKFSLMPVANHLSKIINKSCELIDAPNSDTIFNSNCQVQLLENIRFFHGEKINSDELGYQLANLGDVYVFDAFGTAHREQASTHSAIKQSKVACAGLLLEKENNFLGKVLDNYENPYLAVIGGAKVSTKLELIKHINNVAENIIVGGGIANTFICAAGYQVGKSLIEDSMIDVAKEILNEGKILLPKKVITSDSFEGSNVKEKSIADIEDHEMILDLKIENETHTIINSAKTILWNGPMGVFENELFEDGTKTLSQAISNSSAFSIAGGGETLSAINKYISLDDVSYCSTGGGAFLEFMEGKILPSIKALNAKNREE
jgi:phosphoglycerate kinase